MGEGGWSILEIIIVLILVIALLSRVFGTGLQDGKSTVPDVATYQAPKDIVVPSFNDCGKLMVTTPKPLEKVVVTTAGIIVKGSVMTCNIIDVAPELFTITVVDVQARTLAEPLTVPVLASKDVVAFDYYIPFTAVAIPGTGYVIITRTSNTGTQIPDSGDRIPIRFVN